MVCSTSAIHPCFGWRLLRRSRGEIPEPARNALNTNMKDMNFVTAAQCCNITRRMSLPRGRSLRQWHTDRSVGAKKKISATGEDLRVATRRGTPKKNSKTAQTLLLHHTNSVIISPEITSGKPSIRSGNCRDSRINSPPSIECGNTCCKNMPT